MAAKNVLVRILQAIRIDWIDYFCNDVVSMPEKLASVHEKSGTVDTDPDAVAYARDQLGAVTKEHVVPVNNAPASGAPAVSVEGGAAGQEDAQAKSATATAAGADVGAANVAETK